MKTAGSIDGGWRVTSSMVHYSLTASHQTVNVETLPLNLLRTSVRRRVAGGSSKAVLHLTDGAT